MKDYGLVRSAVEPMEIEITQTKVFIASNIEHLVFEDAESSDEEYPVDEWQFGLVEYDKDEYIKMISEHNTNLEDELTSTQLALVDVYEMIGD